MSDTHARAAKAARKKPSRNPKPAGEPPAGKAGAGGETPDRAYYRATWGFDPVADARDLGDGWHRLEAWCPLDHDPPLQAAGVTLGARVDWRGDDVRNRIVLRREKTDVTVDCVHTVVFEGHTGKFLARDDQAIGDLIRNERDRPSLAKLPAEEHFTALKSFVAGIAEIGVLQISPAYGIHEELRHQIRRAVKKIAPSIWDAKILDRVVKIATEKGPEKLAHLFRMHASLDKLQDRLFRNPGLMERVSEHVPDLPWAQLQLEWQARRAIRHNFKVTGGRVLNDEDLWEVPQVEVYPRGPLCVVPFPGYLFSRDPDLNSPAVARARLEQFFRRYTIEGKILPGRHKYDIQKLEENIKRDPYPPWQSMLDDRKDEALRESAMIVAAHPLAPPDVVAFLARSPWHEVRAEVAARSDLSFEIRAQLAHDPSWNVVDALKRTKEPERTLHSGHKSPDQDLASNPSTPPDVLARLVQNKQYEIRAAVAENPAAPIALFEKLARDPEHNVKVGLLRNPALPAPVLELLAHDPDSWVRGGAAHHPATPVETLEQLARDPERDVRAELAGNPHIGHTLINQLAQETNVAIRRALARNPSCPPDVLSRLSEENNWEIARSLVAHPATPPAVLRGLASHWDIRLRLELTVRADVGIDLLELLAQDKQPSVRVIAQARLGSGGSMPTRTPGQILSPGEILWLLVSHPQQLFRFISLGEDDFSPEHARWLRNLLETSPDIPDIEWEVGKISTWEYFSVGPVWGHGLDGCLNNQDDPIEGTTYHLALDGLRGMACGKLPCMLLECDIKPF